MARLPLCVIGGGQIGMRHVEVAMTSDMVDLTCVVEPYEPRRKELQAQGLTAVATIDDAPAQTRAAVSATPTQIHAASATACIGKGWATIVEKPITATVGQGRELVALAERTGVPLITGHHRRCHPFSIAARDAIARCGRVIAVQGLWSLRKPDNYFDVAWRREPGAGVLMTNMSHEIDLIRFLLGDIDVVQAMTSDAYRGLKVEDTAAINLQFANGALGQFTMSDAGASPWAFEAATGENPALAYSGQDYIRITGEAGSLSFPSLTFWSAENPDWTKPLTADQGRVFERIDPLLAQVDRFAALVGGAQDDILCTAQDGLAALGLTLAAKLSGKTGTPVRPQDVPHDYIGD